MMDDLIAEVRELVDKEYGRASVKFGSRNNSDHESYAVLLEELEEAHAECGAAHDVLRYFWDLVKRNGSDEEKYKICNKLEACALLAACEFIQVAAMAQKAALTVGDRNVVIDFTARGGGT